MLASASPQRSAILTMLGVSFRIEVPGVEEADVGDPRELVLENARRKARAVVGPTVLGVDTLVALEGGVRGKPGDEEEAARFLMALSGRTHEVWSGMALRDASRERTATAMTRVTFRTLDDSWLSWYLAAGEWRGRAGGYAIQGRGAALVERIEGDYWNVVGLPVRELVRLAPELVRGS